MIRMKAFASERVSIAALFPLAVQSPHAHLSPLIAHPLTHLLSMSIARHNRCFGPFWTKLAQKMTDVVF
jgi:hypothetical protein